MERISLKIYKTIHVKGTSLSKHLIQLTCPGIFSLVVECLLRETGVHGFDPGLRHISRIKWYLALRLKG